MIRRVASFAIEMANRSYFFIFLLMMFECMMLMVMVLRLNFFFFECMCMDVNVGYVLLYFATTRIASVFVSTRINAYALFVCVMVKLCVCVVFCVCMLCFCSGFNVLMLL